MSRSIAIGLALAALLAGSAQAQTKVTASAPAANAHVMEPVKEIRITFDQPVDPKAAMVTLKTSAGKVVKTGPAKVDGAQLVLPVESGKLAEGWYTVEWMIHGSSHAQGSYTFMAM